jgi:serine phosphatase RsbU (regulator of sigma subunit)/PAS domain-containing protein
VSNGPGLDQSGEPSTGEHPVVRPRPAGPAAAGRPAGGRAAGRTSAGNPDGGRTAGARSAGRSAGRAAPRKAAAPRRADRPAAGRPADTGGAALRSRGAELRLAAALPGVDLVPLLDAAMAEVEAAADVLAGQESGGTSAAAVHVERRLLHAVFLELPVPVFLLGQDRTIRRANVAAAHLLGSGPGYATGKQFTALVDTPDRPRVQTQLADAFRTGESRQVSCGLLGVDGLVQAELTLRMAGLRSDADQLIVAITGDGARSSPDPAPAAGRGARHDDLELVRQVTRRQDLVTGVSRLLLADISASEAALVQRCARMLAGELADWVIVDTERRGMLRRQFVTGPADPRAEELTRIVADTNPEPGSVPALVHESGSSQLLTHPEETDALGRGPDDVPLVMLLGAASVLSVPLSDGQSGYGTLTLVARASRGQFGLADAGLAESIGEQLALAIRAGRVFRRHSAVAEALHASVLPRTLAPLPGVEVAAAHIAAAGPDVGGDFYDVYPTPAGPGLAIGDVCGSARDTAAVTAAARNAIRVIGRSQADPAAVLRGANDAMLGENLSGEFVTAHAARLRWDSGTLTLTLATSGQPAPAIISIDGQVRQVRGGGQPLGIFPDAEPAVQDLRLTPGDTVFFFSDGVADARSVEHGNFGERLADELAALAGMSAGDIAADMRRRVLDFCDGEVRDDMTMLVLRVQEPPAR